MIKLLEKITHIYSGVLKDKLTGLYLHGSVAFGCFNERQSDIDFLAVVSASLSEAEKVEIIENLVKISGNVPQKGIEMSVVQEKYLAPFVYPTPYELHFSESHREAYQADIAAYCHKLTGVDKDLAAHVTVINKAGITLYGKPKKQVFASVPRENYMDSLLYDIENAVSEIERSPVYYILNLCRVLAFAQENAVLSKAEGGRWGVENLPEYADIITCALENYVNNIPFSRISGLTDFARDMTQRIAHCP